MFNLYQIVTDSQGGQGLDNLAKQFGLTREQTDGAVKALVPALSTAFMAKAAQPGGLGDLAGGMADGQHARAYADPAAASDPSTQQKGGSIAGSIFGNNAIVEQVVQQASRYTGLPAATLQQMLPVIVSIIVGGVGTLMRDQGMGGLLGQLANSGLGEILGQFGGGAGKPPGSTSSGGMGDVFSNILSSFMGGGRTTTPQQPITPTGAAPGPAPDSSGLSPAMQAGMDALSKMFHPGVQASAAQPDNLGEQISSILGGGKR